MVEVYVAADPVAEQVAREWLALTDAGRVEESYAASAALFRRTLTVTSWSLEYSAVRACLGAVRSRTPHSRRSTGSFGSARSSSTGTAPWMNGSPRCARRTAGGVWSAITCRRRSKHRMASSPNRKAEALDG